MELRDAIHARQSTRKFSGKPISRQALEEMVLAASQAPNGRSSFTWQFTVVEDEKDIKRLVDAMGKALGREGYDMYGPTALILVSDQRDDVNYLANCACALQNIFLTAHDLGIGSVWINQLRQTADDPDVRQILTDFGVPEDHLVGGIAALGYADQKTPKKEREVPVVYVSDR